MTAFGIATIVTEYSIPTPELARWVEDVGFDSLFFSEHTHIPLRTTLRRPDEWYKMFFDPFVCLAAAAAVTGQIELGTAICLLPQHHPIALAKTVASIERVAGGRFVLGVGAGWNAPEMSDFGVRYADRWQELRERVLAMREIWRNEIGEFHGSFVRFDPMWCWPKPVQPGGPPVLIGADPKPVTFQRIVDFADGWIPMDYRTLDLGAGLNELRECAAAAGRDPAELRLAVLTGTAASKDPGWHPRRIDELRDLGFGRILFLVEPGLPDEQWPVLERYAALLERTG